MALLDAGHQRIVPPGQDEGNDHDHQAGEDRQGWQQGHLLPELQPSEHFRYPEIARTLTPPSVGFSVT